LILLRPNAVILLIVALSAPSTFATTTHRSTTSKHASTLAPAHTTSSHSPSAHAASSRSHTGKKTTASARGKRLHGQQAMEPERVTQIQTALIHAHYLSKDADGQWDSTTAAAMQKFQADHGWQTKLMPDSRAIKALGLGPDYSNAINAKNASFNPPPPANTIPPSITAGFTQGSGVVR
jgi:peptidoglycan hydrolase-like protein with peptidoglycan-binding domain